MDQETGTRPHSQRQKLDGAVQLQAGGKQGAIRVPEPEPEPESKSESLVYLELASVVIPPGGLGSKRARCEWESTQEDEREVLILNVRRIMLYQ